MKYEGIIEKHKKFNKRERDHILLITNHGSHTPVITITIDTGGQNIYVNDFGRALVNFGYKVTILNRGGYRHPVTGELQKGVVYYNEVWKKGGNFCRIIYLEDGIRKFIEKEKLTGMNLIKEAEFFFKKAEEIDLNLSKISFINSHYWDGGILGKIIKEKLKKTGKLCPHIWTPHSLAILKKKNYEGAPNKEIEKFNFDTRIAFEEEVINNADAVVSTSDEIKNTMEEYSNRVKKHLRCPPGVNIRLFRPRRIEGCNSALERLREITKMDREKLLQMVKNNIVFLEMSRTDVTKRKDIILDAFTKIKNKDKAILIMNCTHKGTLQRKLERIINMAENKDRIIFITESLPLQEVAEIFALADIYATASVMEGWGISVQQGCTTRSAIISSRYVPFINYVLKDHAIIVRDQNPRVYANEMDKLIENPRFRGQLADNAYNIAVKISAWKNLTKRLLDDMKKEKII